jgi:hypothetical protein
LTIEELRSHPLIYAALRLREEYKVNHRELQYPTIPSITPVPRALPRVRVTPRTSIRTSPRRRAHSTIPATSRSAHQTVVTFPGPLDLRPHIDASPPTASSASGISVNDSDDEFLNFDLRESTRIRQEGRRREQLREETTSDQSEAHSQVIYDRRRFISTHFYVVSKVPICSDTKQLIHV